MAPRSVRLAAIFPPALRLLTRAWNREADQVLAELDITLAAAAPLGYLLINREPMHQNAIAEAIGMEPPSLVRLLDQLAAGELIERKEDPADRRAKVVVLTPKGRKLAEKAVEAGLDLRARLLADVTDEDLEATLRVFRAIGKTIGRDDIVREGPGVVAEEALARRLAREKKAATRRKGS